LGGAFDVAWAVTFPANGSGSVRIANLRRSGSTIAQGEPFLDVRAFFATRVGGFVGLIQAAAGDYFDVEHNQDSGSTLTAVAGGGTTFLSVIRRAST
jgi:hypothetical protein